MQRFWLLFSLLGLISIQAPAFAQTQSETAGDEKLRDFSPDRPSKATGAITIERGHIEIETDLINIAHQKTDGVSSQVLLAPNLTLRYGLTSDIDFEINLPPYTWTQSNFNERRLTKESGLGDTVLRFKVNFLGNDEGDVAFALSPYVTIPTANSQIGNGSTEGGMSALLSMNLPAGFLATFNSEIDALKNDTGSCMHTNIAGVANLGHALMEGGLVSGEIWTAVNYEPAKTIRQASADFSLAFALPADSQFDLGINLGLNSNTPRTQFYAGFARRF
jgi:hypothetical protein